MQKYNVLQAIFMSFYSPSLYRDVAKNWGGKAFLYLFIIVALSWIFFVYQIQHGLNHAYKKGSDKVVEQIPVLTIKEGKVSTPENRPYIVKDPDTQETIAVIDTSGQITTLEQAKANLLVTETAIISQPKPNEMRTNQIPSNLNMVIDPNVVNHYIEKYLGFAWIFLFVIFTIFSYVYRIFQALIYAIIGRIFSAITSAHLTYVQVLQIAMVAITPAIIIATIIDFFIIIFPHQLLAYFVLAMIYLFFGVIANRKQVDEDQPLVTK